MSIICKTTFYGQITMTHMLKIVVGRHMLMIVDNEEFYEQEKPLALKDIRYLIVILRQVTLVTSSFPRCMSFFDDFYLLLNSLVSFCFPIIKLTACIISTRSKIL